MIYTKAQIKRMKKEFGLDDEIILRALGEKGSDKAQKQAFEVLRHAMSLTKKAPPKAVTKACEGLKV